MQVAKPFDIPKEMIWEAYQKVKSKGGSAGIDKETIELFESDLKSNLYKIWNRMSSGSYFPPAVKAVPIPKKTGGIRILGVPTVADRVAQTVVKTVLEGILEPIFDDNSFGYRPKRSAKDAIAITRTRCWRYNWVVEFDIKGLFDNIKHDLLMKALRHHCDNKWILLYITRWLTAPMQNEDGKLVERNKGTPQGGVVSPLLANLFLHYAFDCWLRRAMPRVPFCRYADDGILHCRTKKQAEFVMRMIAARFRECGLELNQQKTQIILCKDANRREEFPTVSFDFLGYTFQPRTCIRKDGYRYSNFLPAISRSAMKDISRRIRSWRIQLKSAKSLQDLSDMFNPILRGWFNYYGYFYKSAMNRIWRNLNWYLVRWVQRRCKKFSRRKCRKYLSYLARKSPSLFIHWQIGFFPC